MGLTLLSAPLGEPLTLTEVKSHLRVDHTADDALIAIYLRAAREYIDGPGGFLGRALVRQSWRLSLDGFPTDEIRIPLPPLSSVDAIRYDDTSGDEQLVNSQNFWVDKASEPGWIVRVDGVDWPTTLDGVNTVRVDFTAGYAPGTNSPIDYGENIPFNIKAAMLLMIGNMYENREDNVVGVISTRLSNGAEYLLRRHKIDLSMA